MSHVFVFQQPKFYLPHCRVGEADFKKHLPSHLRRPPRGPAGPAERDANLTPLGAPAIPGLGGMADLAAGSEAQGANSVPIGVRQVSQNAARSFVVSATSGRAWQATSMFCCIMSDYLCWSLSYFW